METEKPENHAGCLQNCCLQASCRQWLNEHLSIISKKYEKRISALEKDVLSLKKQNQAVADILTNAFKTSVKEKEERESTKLLPPELSTKEAMVLWKKAIEAGFVDKSFLPLISNAQAALLANEMARRLNIRNKWKVFGDFWNIKFMKNDYYRIVSQKQMPEFQKSIVEKLIDR